MDSKILIDEIAELGEVPQRGSSIVGDASLPSLMTARAPLAQALQNLVSNAIKHHDRPNDGHVLIAARSNRHMTEFTVTG